jgi:hypothetical protein
MPDPLTVECPHCGKSFQVTESVSWRFSLLCDSCIQKETNKPSNPKWDREASEFIFNQNEREQWEENNNDRN